MKIKTKLGTFNPTLNLEYKSTNDFIGSMELTKDFVEDSQKRPSYYGLATRNNLPVRICGELSFTTKAIYY